jgi:short-subunit dehydrogenase
VTRQNILITGASSGLGAGMAREFAARGRNLALCARRTDRLEALKADLLRERPDLTIAVAGLDVNEHHRVPEVFADLGHELGGIDRVIVNAGVGGGAPLGSGYPGANTATLETNLVAALIQIEAALVMFNKVGSGHLVLMSSVVSAKGIPGGWASYAASKAGLRSLGESLRSEYANGPIRISVIEPGHIQSEMARQAEFQKFMVDNATGVKAVVKAIERERGRSVVPWWPWAPVIQLMRVLPPRLIKVRA